MVFCKGNVCRDGKREEDQIEAPYHPPKFYRRRTNLGHVDFALSYQALTSSPSSS
jgi:hypothetical protein